MIGIALRFAIGRPRPAGDIFLPPLELLRPKLLLRIAKSICLGRRTSAELLIRDEAVQRKMMISSFSDIDGSQ
ncbi:hypothetical protein [Bradyrhizobium sp. STM 3562]|uniref:hypothetical protein n=1 Tax=Bradyrhizobium sp. STM 3562 TaxID=578924 RepID=UPI00388EC7A3